MRAEGIILYSTRHRVAIWQILVFFLVILAYALLWNFPLHFWTCDAHQTSLRQTRGAGSSLSSLGRSALHLSKAGCQKAAIMSHSHRFHIITPLEETLACFLYYLQVFLNFGHWLTGGYWWADRVRCISEYVGCWTPNTWLGQTLGQSLANTRPLSWLLETRDGLLIGPSFQIEYRQYEVSIRRL